MASIVFEGVSKVFRRQGIRSWLGHNGDGGNYALKGVSLAVSSGQILVLMGPNGSGKTTLLKLVVRMLLPDAGRILVHGEDVSRDTAASRGSVGYAVASERSFFPRLTARENLEYFAVLENIGRAHRRNAVYAALQQIDLFSASETVVAKFSAGMWQRLGLARAILKRPSILLLDEPTRSLDLKSADSFWRMIRKTADGGVTILMASHSVEEARAVGDRIAVLREGSLIGVHGVGELGHDDIRKMYFHDLGDDSGAREFVRADPRGAD